MTPLSCVSVIRAATLAFLIGYLLLGLSIFGDYGISWDEFPTREYGLMNVEHQISSQHALDSLRAVKGPMYERFGPAFEIVLVGTEKALGLHSLRSVFLVRHLINFLTFFIGVVLFLRLCWRRFAPGIALLATISLVASPQLFAHAFFNVKDISFLTVFVGTMLTLDHFLGRPGWRTVVVHGLTSGLLIGVRVLGFFPVMLTTGAALLRRPSGRTVGLLAAYGAIVVIVLPFVWPVLRIDPVGIVRDALLGATSNPYRATNLFQGAQLQANALPWSYVPVWMAITSPLVITISAIGGIVLALARLVRRPRAHLAGEEQRDALVLAWFLLPVVGCMVLRPILYDGWRHLYFVYPAFVYLAAITMEWIATALTSRVTSMRPPVTHAALSAIYLACLGPPVAFMLANHPLEHLYFNRLAGRDMAEIKQRFELDYWGLSYRQALEHIFATDPRPLVRVRVANYPGFLNSTMLSPADRRRLVYVHEGEPADYFVGNY
ncbi:MAG: hypothetical protein H0W68_12255, partial [Gemmatimonadaceae bacterium]|nr:hypothetical protein [Gemmatimonadaceae bacterium]